MAYSIKEAYLTIQGEGARTGTVSVFCRFAGCNLWSGREEDRHEADCTFCDTDFVGTDGPEGGRFGTATNLVDHLQAVWSRDANKDAGPAVVFTGGEPLLQMDAALIDACHGRGFFVAVETNGTVQRPDNLDWLCVSPKKTIDFLKITRGNELKLVYPQSNIRPEDFEHLDFDYFFLQPREDGGNCFTHVPAAIAYCKQHPKWRLSLQTHKLINIP
jgi:7-carboxy-7-deazaguanine synthase